MRSDLLTTAYDYSDVPAQDFSAWFGEFGGQYAPEILKSALDELEAEYLNARSDPNFQAEFARLLRDYVGRPSPLYRADRLAAAWNVNKLYLKREDANFTGSHKINNAIGQALIARRMGKTRIIAETGAGQHGVATATACALFGFKCAVYMGAEDVRRQALNVFRMRLLGAEVIPVTSGQGTLKDATSEAMRDWAASVRDTHYIIGSVVGPHPFPRMVGEFQSIISHEIFDQHAALESSAPYLVAACIGGGLNAAGAFARFIPDPAVRLVGFEAGGKGSAVGEHAASVTRGEIGIFHSFKSLLLQDAGGQVVDVHSISAGLDYPGVGPLHAWLFASGRAEYRSVSDAAALDAFEELCRLEGVIPALESAHALAGLRALIAAENWSLAERSARSLVVCLSGRGDKDVAEVARLRGQSIA